MAPERDRKKEFFSVTLETVENDPARLLTRDNFSTKDDA